MRGRGPPALSPHPPLITPSPHISPSSPALPRRTCQPQVCQKVQRQGNFALYAKPWPRYVSCTTQGPFVQACNAGLKWNDKKKDCV